MNTDNKVTTPVQDGERQFYENIYHEYRHAVDVEIPELHERISQLEQERKEIASDAIDFMKVDMQISSSLINS